MYPVLGIQDLDDALIGKEDSSNNNDKRFKDGQDGDHLMTPSQSVECGCHCRMDDNWIPDIHLTVPISMRACFIILKSRWESSQQETWKLPEIATTACSLLAGYSYGALRGEEVILVGIGLLRKHWIVDTYHEVKHVALMLVGWFKQVNKMKKYCQPLVFKTKSGMNI